MKNKLVFIMGLGREHCLNINKALYYCTLWSSFLCEVRDTLCEVVEAVLQWWGPGCIGCCDAAVLYNVLRSRPTLQYYCAQ